MFASFFESGRVTMSFLDGELIPVAGVGATALATAGVMDPDLEPLFSDGRHLQHWPNHDNHIHVRVSESPYGAGGSAGFDEPFEAP